MTSKNMTRRRAERGLSLVELMVAMVIGLIVIIVVYQMFVTSEGTRRTAVAGSDAQMSAAIAMNALQEQIRNAGYGLTGADPVSLTKPLGCIVKGWNVSSGGYLTLNGTEGFPLVPVSIQQGADNNAAGVGKDADTITVVYSDLDYPTVSVNLLVSMLNTTADLRVTNRYAITPGNLIILAQNRGTFGAVLPAQPADTREALNAPLCALAETTGAPTGAGFLDTVKHGLGSYTDLNGNNQSVRFNGPGGIGASTANPAGLLFTDKASVYNIGTNPSVVTFSVQNNQLMMSNLLGAVNQPLVDGVVSLQAQYGVGVDTNADGYADVFNPSGGQGAWKSTLNLALATDQPGMVMAVRLAVLTRANLIEAKDKSTGLCTATSAASPELVWTGGAFDVTGTVDWDCYRYKKFEMVIPLRNIIWMPT